MKVICVYFPEDFSQLQSFAEASLKFSPQIALGRHWLFIEIEKCAKLMTEQDFFSELSQWLTLYEQPAELAVGHSMATSLCYAKYKIKKQEELPISALAQYFDPLQTHDQEVENFEKELQLLQSLGIYKLKDIKALAHKEITSRFNKKFRKAIDSWLYGSNHNWPFFKITESLQESTFLHYSQKVNDLEPLLFILRPLVRRICARLVGRGLKACELVVKLEQEKYSHVQEASRFIKVKMNFPHNDSETLFKILQESLQQELQKKALESSLIEVRLSVTESLLGRSLQKDFFSQDQELQEAQEALMLRLIQRLGENKVFYAQVKEEHLPELNWSRQSQPPACKDLPLPKRPLRLLYPPQKIVCKMSQLKALYGPERLQGQWWSKEHHRDYYVAHYKNGSCLWLYKQDEQFFLHGIFG